MPYIFVEYVSKIMVLILKGEEEKLPDDNLYFGTVSDDSDIVTLDVPKLTYWKSRRSNNY